MEKGHSSRLPQYPTKSCGLDLLPARSRQVLGEQPSAGGGATGVSGVCRARRRSEPTVVPTRSGPAVDGYGLDRRILPAMDGIVSSISSGFIPASLSVHRSGALLRAPTDSPASAIANAVAALVRDSLHRPGIPADRPGIVAGPLSAEHSQDARVVLSLRAPDHRGRSSSGARSGFGRINHASDDAQSRSPDPWHSRASCRELPSRSCRRPQSWNVSTRRLRRCV